VWCFFPLFGVGPHLLKCEKTYLLYDLRVWDLILPRAGSEVY
jgi:hypothetical protein